jgi:hypothetical protein
VLVRPVVVTRPVRLVRLAAGTPQNTWHLSTRSPYGHDTYAAPS